MCSEESGTRHVNKNGHESRLVVSLGPTLKKRGLGSINYKQRHTTIDVLCKDVNIKIKTILQVVQFTLKKQSEE